MNNKKQLIINLTAIYSSIFLSSVPFGIIAVLIAVKMDKFVGDETLISLSAAMQIFAGIFFAKYLPRISKKLGIIRTVQIATITAAIMALVMYQYFGYFKKKSIFPTAERQLWNNEPSQLDRKVLPEDPSTTQRSSTGDQVLREEYLPRSLAGPSANGRTA